MGERGRRHFSLKNLAPSHGQIPLLAPVFGEGGGEIMNLEVIRDNKHRLLRVETLEENCDEPGRLDPHSYQPKDFIVLVNRQLRLLNSSITK